MNDYRHYEDPKSIRRYVLCGSDYVSWNKSLLDVLVRAYLVFRPERAGFSDEASSSMISKASLEIRMPVLRWLRREIVC